MTTTQTQIDSFIDEYEELKVARAAWSWESTPVDYAKVDEARAVLISEGCEAGCGCFLKAAANCIDRDQKWTLANLLRHGRYFHKADNAAVEPPKPAVRKRSVRRIRSIEKRSRDL